MRDHHEWGVGAMGLLSSLAPPMLQLWTHPGEAGLGGPSWDAKVQNPSRIWTGHVLQHLCCLLAPLDVLLLPPQPCQAPSWLHPSASWAQELETASATAQAQGLALGTPRDWGCWLLPAFLEHGRSCLGIAQPGLCAKCCRPVQPCAVML